MIKSLSIHLLIFLPLFFSAVDYFKDDYVSENVLKKLIRQNVVEEVVKKETSEQFLFRENVPCDYFILILQGMLAIGKSVELRFLTPSDLSAIFFLFIECYNLQNLSVINM